MPIALEGKRLDEGFLAKVKERRRKYYEQSYFEVYVFDEKYRTISVHPVFEGIFSSGREGWGIKGWIDGNYYDHITFANGRILYLEEEGLDVGLFELLGSLIPSGGSLMVAYSMMWGEGEAHKETQQGLSLKVPKAATPIGYLLFRAGCGYEIKDWYFAEGGNEGPPKLQGFKPLGPELEYKKAALVKELKEFVEREGEDEIVKRGIVRAREILRTLVKGLWHEVRDRDR